MKKHLLTIAIIATVIIASGAGFDTKSIVTAPSEEYIESSKESLTKNITTIGKLKESVIVSGVVKEVRNGQVIITTKKDNADDITILKVGEAGIIDMLTGDYTDIDSVKAGESVTAYCHPFAPAIYPPQLGVQALLVNAEKEGAAALRIITKEKISSENPYNELSAIGYIDRDEEYVVWFSENTDIMDNNGNKIKADDLKTGMEILVWCDKMLQSLPAHANANKAVVLSYKNTEIAADNAGDIRPAVITGETLIIDGDMIFHIMEKDKPVVTKQNLTMYPVRAIAEAIGTTVEWDNGTVLFTKDGMNRASFKINDNMYTFSIALGYLDEGNTFQNINGRAYAPKEFFERVFNCYFE